MLSQNEINNSKFNIDQINKINEILQFEYSMEFERRLNIESRLNILIAFFLPVITLILSKFNNNQISIITLDLNDNLTLEFICFIMFLAINAKLLYSIYIVLKPSKIESFAIDIFSIQNLLPVYKENSDNSYNLYMMQLNQHLYNRIKSYKKTNEIKTKNYKIALFLMVAQTIVFILF